MKTSTQTYDAAFSPSEQAICQLLAAEITRQLPEAQKKIWHGHPVWFLSGNPIVGYSRIKTGIRVMFWSGASFDDARLKVGIGKFRDASILFTDVSQINVDDLAGWLAKARHIQWDYANIVRRKGRLEKVGGW